VEVVEEAVEPEPAADAEEAVESEEGVEAVEAAEPTKEPAVEPGAWSLASVKREDVVVSYNVPVDVAEGEEPRYETRQAEVTDFANDGAAVSLTFKGEGPDASVDAYTVRFAGTESYAVVHVVPEDNGVVIEDVDYDAQVAELVYYKVPNPAAMALVDPALLEQFPNLSMTPAELLEQEQLVDLGEATLTYTDIVAQVLAS
jgi:hypothetical protein